MPFPAIFRTRSVSNNGRYARLSPPASPRVVPAAGPQIGNLEDAVGALERWWATGHKGTEGDKAGGSGWRVWVTRAPLIGKFRALHRLVMLMLLQYSGVLDPCVDLRAFRGLGGS